MVLHVLRNPFSRIKNLLHSIEVSREISAKTIQTNIIHTIEVLGKLSSFRKREQEQFLKTILAPGLRGLSHINQHATRKFNRINPSSDFHQYLMSEFITKGFQKIRSVRKTTVIKFLYGDAPSEREPLIKVIDLKLISLLKKVDNWNFDIFELKSRDSYTALKSMAFFLINKYGLILRFQIIAEQLLQFLGKAESMYLINKNAYHNNIHAADTMQTIHYILSQTGIMNSLADLDIFAIFFAAIILHIDSPGVSNEFQQEVSSEFAILYNDKNINENRCLSKGFKLLNSSGCNIVRGLSRQDYREFRTLTIELTLANMSTASIPIKYVEVLRSNWGSPIDVPCLLSNILHLSEVGHYGKRWDIHYKWIQALNKERQSANHVMKDHMYFDFEYATLATDIAVEQYDFLDTFFEPRMKLMTLMIQHNLRQRDKVDVDLEDSDDSDVSCESYELDARTTKVQKAPTAASPFKHVHKKSIRKTVVEDSDINCLLRQSSVSMPWDWHIADNKTMWTIITRKLYFDYCEDSILFERSGNDNMFAPLLKSCTGSYP